MSNQQLLAEFIYKQPIPYPDQVPVIEQAIATLSQWACQTEDERLQQLVADAQEKIEESKDWIWE